MDGRRLRWTVWAFVDSLILKPDILVHCVPSLSFVQFKSISYFLLADVGQTLCVEQAFGAAPSFVTSCCSALRVSWHLGPPYHHHHHYYHQHIAVLDFLVIWVWKSRQSMQRPNGQQQRLWSWAINYTITIFTIFAIFTIFIIIIITPILSVLQVSWHLRSP